ncbi:MAG: beta-lactamase family protein [Roseivirga sp.]|nr:beta-lactamase family protein [Roseivirga sp.]
MKLIFISLVTLCLILPLRGQNYVDSTYTEQIQQAQKMLEALKEGQHIPGLSIAVGKGGKFIWQQGMGLANMKEGQEVIPDTKFRIGSISKSLTAFALGKLFDQGKLDWADPVSKYLSYEGAPEYTFTIKQLAGHQAGVRHYKGTEFYSKKAYASIEESLSIFRNDKLLFEPGTDYHYTTFGYSLLGRLIEENSGKAYDQYMVTEVLEPLGMENTVLADAGYDESGKALFYSKGGKREAGKVNLSNKWAGGGFLSTPTDLVRFLNNASKVVSFSTLFELITPQRLADGSSTGYGIGFRISKVQATDEMIVHHGGSILGARAFLLALPDEQLVVAICTNTEAQFGVNEVYALAKLFK